MNANTPKITRASLACSPVASGISPQVARYEAGAQPTSNDGWGCQPICAGCNRGAIYSCLCGPWPEDDDMMPVADMKRVAPEIFDGSSWLRAETSALGMPGAAK